MIWAFPTPNRPPVSAILRRSIFDVLVSNAENDFVKSLKLSNIDYDNNHITYELKLPTLNYLNYKELIKKQLKKIKKKKKKKKIVMFLN